MHHKLLPILSNLAVFALIISRPRCQSFVVFMVHRSDIVKSGQFSPSSVIRSPHANAQKNRA